MSFTGSLNKTNLLKSVLIGCASILTIQHAQAQTLDPRNPGPLKAGINSSTVDNFVGTQYWYYDADPGQHSVKVTFQSMGVLGAPMRNTLAVTLSSPLGSEKKLCVSEKMPESVVFTGKMTKPTKMVIRLDALAPTGLVRQGGDYQIEVTGAVHFGGGGNGAVGATTDTPFGGAVGGKDQICRAYVSFLNNWGITKFAPDGTVTCADGTIGKWKLEDVDTQSYTVTLGDGRLSLIYMPGRGLIQADDKSVVIFKQMK